ncbi:hypothetical protein [Collimonas silvisoli]|nr:hypothetical protein [Collimonas silvisoli]
MEIRSRFHAKYPDQEFSEEQKAPRALAYLAPAQALYDRLEQVQKKAAG